MTKLSDTQRAILEAAAQHPEHLVYPPERLPAGARQKVAQALLKQDLVIGLHRPAYDAAAKWTVDGEEMLFKITDDGLRAIGIDPNAGDVQGAPAHDPTIWPKGIPVLGIPDDEQTEEPAPSTPVAATAPTGGEEEAPRDEDAPVPKVAHAAPARAPRANLRDAAAAVLYAYDNFKSMEEPIAALRAALAGAPPRTARDPGVPRKRREGTKQETALSLLRREEGATIAQICEATGWQPHTVRGFFAGLKKRQGIEVKVRERIRLVGPNKTGAKGSFTIYQID
jgi:hypothetical protein